MVQTVKSDTDATNVSNTRPVRTRKESPLRPSHAPCEDDGGEAKLLNLHGGVHGVRLQAYCATREAGDQDGLWTPVSQGLLEGLVGTLRRCRARSHLSRLPHAFALRYDRTRSGLR